MHISLRAGLALLALFVVVSPARADHWVWYSPLRLRSDAFTGYDDNIFIAPGVPSPAIRVSVDSPNTYPVILGTVFSDRGLIDSVAVCYENEGNNSYIAGVRLTLTASPQFADVWHDDLVSLGGTGAGCYRRQLVQYPPALFAYGSVAITLFLDMEPGNYVEIGAVGLHVRGDVTAVADTPQPPALILAQNYPNPLRARTWIGFTLEEPAPVSVEIHDPTGRRVRTLLDTGRQPAGNHRVQWDARDEHGRRLASGIYTYRVRIGDRVGSRRMVVIH